jgi:hypothetical protein
MKPTCSALVLVVSTLAITSVVFAAPAKEHVFDGGLDLVFDATMKAVETNWKRVQASDRSAGTIRFHTTVSPTTWGEDCTVVLRDLGNGRVEVSLHATNSAQVYAWGVGGRIAQRLFKSIQNELLLISSPKTPSPTSSGQK